MNSTCKLIKELRENSELSASEFAKIMGVTKSSVSRWESDEKPGIENLYQIARYFRVSVDELLNGRLKEDDNLNQFVTKYDLSYYNIPKLIADSNTKEIIAYFKKCQAIKLRFLKLLPRAAYHGLADIDLEEFKYLNTYVGINSYVCEYKRDFKSIFEGKLDQNEMKAVKDFYEKIKELPKQEKDWELEKIVYFKPKLYEEEIIKFRLFEPFVEMYKLLPQPDKNAILNNTLNNERSIDAIRNKYILAMLSNGGKILKYDYWHGNYWDDDVIKSLEKLPKFIIKERKININESDYIQFNGECSYQDYIKVIDEDKTIKLKEACLLRHTRPLEYYKKLKNGDFDTLLNF